MDGTASTSKEDASESGTLLDQPKESLVQILLTLGFTREEAGEVSMKVKLLSLFFYNYII